MEAWPWGPIRKLLPPWCVRPLLKLSVSPEPSLWPTEKGLVRDVCSIAL